MLDGQRKMEFLKQLPVTSHGRHFEIRSKVLGVYDKGKSSVTETEQRLVDAETGETYTRAVGSAFFVGQGGWGGPKGESSILHSLMLRLSTMLIMWIDRRERPSLQSASWQITHRNLRAPTHPRVRTPLPPKRRLQPSPRRPRARCKDGFRRRHHARSLLMEQHCARSPQGAW